MRIAIGIVLAAVFLFDYQGIAAQAEFERSEPAPNAIISQSPVVVQVWFSEALDLQQSTLQLYDQSGSAVAGTIQEAVADDSSLTLAPAEPLVRGTYSVAWDTVAADDDRRSQSYIAFTIATASDIPNVTAQIAATSDESGPPLWLRTLSHWFVLLTLTPLIAVWLIWLVVLRPAAGPDEATAGAMSRRIRTLTAYALALALGASVLALFVEAATIDDSGALMTRIANLLFGSRYGKLWAVQIALLVAVGVTLEWATWLQPMRDRVFSGLILVLTLSLGIPASLTSHANDVVSSRTIAIVFDWAHLTSAAMWFGGLFWLLAGPIRSSEMIRDQRSVLVAALSRFSAVAIVCWGMLILTGAYAGWVQVGSLHALRNTDYGKSLMLKLILVGIVLAIAVANLYLVTRRWKTDPDRATGRAIFWSVVAEIVIAVVIFLIVGRMTSLAPAIDVVANQPETTIVRTVDLAERSATLTILPGTVGPNQFILDIPGEPLPMGSEALLAVQLTDGVFGSNEIDLERTDDTRFEWQGSELSVTGDWSAGIVVQSPGGEQREDSISFMVTESGSSSSNPWRLTVHSVAGLLLTAIGLIGIVIGWQVHSKGLRKESMLLGTLSLVFGLGILVADREIPFGPIPPRVLPTDESIAQGEALYQSYCLSCHGATGKGDGPGAAGMLPPPADFTNLAEHSHEDQGWYEAVYLGEPGTDMPAFGDTLTDDEIWHVINYIQVEFQE